MFHLIYTSRESQEFTAAALKKILMTARLRNHEVGVTGVLVYQGGMFLQALEGAEDEVETIFARIEKDPRHCDLTVLHRDLSVGKRRMFGEWSMGFSDAGGAKILKGFIDLNKGLGLSDLTEGKAIELLESIGAASAGRSA